MHLFNIAGYSLLFDYFIGHSEALMINRIDHQYYSEDQLVEVKTSLHLPYYTSSRNYERVDGEIELHGTHYNYVKRKVSNDTLYLLCIPNKPKTDLLRNRDDYASKVADTPANSENGKSTIKKINTLTEYHQPANDCGFAALPHGEKEKAPLFASLLHDNLQDENFRPPRPGFLDFIA